MAFGAQRPPASPLQAARLEIGWKQSQTIYALQQAAAKADKPIMVAEARSLKTMLSRWENGHDRPDATYVDLLCKVYDRSADELGLANVEAVRRIPMPRVNPTISPGMVTYFRNVLAEQVRADNLMGPHHLVDVVRAQVFLLDQVLPNGRGSTRDELLDLAYRYNEFAGWLYQDASDCVNAMHYSDRAMDYALDVCLPTPTPV